MARAKRKNWGLPLYSSRSKGPFSTFFYTEVQIFLRDFRCLSCCYGGGSVIWKLHLSLRLSWERKYMRTRIFPTHWLARAPFPGHSSRKMDWFLQLLLSMAAVQFNESAHPQVKARRKILRNSLPPYWSYIEFSFLSPLAFTYFSESLLIALCVCILFRVFSCESVCVRVVSLFHLVGPGSLAKHLESISFGWCSPRT